MRQSVLVLLLPIILVSNSCQHNDDLKYCQELSFQLFVFNQKGEDVVNPSHTSPLNASDITIISEFEGNDDAEWVIEKMLRPYDYEKIINVNLSGFYYFYAYSPDLAIASFMKNATVKNTIKIAGHPDNEVVFKYNKYGSVDHIYINGKRIIQIINGSPLLYNVKLVI